MKTIHDDVGCFFLKLGKQHRRVKSAHISSATPHPPIPAPEESLQTAAPWWTLRPFLVSHNYKQGCEPSHARLLETRPWNTLDSILDNTLVSLDRFLEVELLGQKARTFFIRIGITYQLSKSPHHFASPQQSLFSLTLSRMLTSKGQIKDLPWRS